MLPNAPAIARIIRAVVNVTSATAEDVWAAAASGATIVVLGAAVKKYNKKAKAYNKKIAAKNKKFMTKKVVGKKVKVKA